MPETPSLYDALLAAGCEIDSHESDLYVKYTPAARDVIAAFALAHPPKPHYDAFISQVDGKVWLDLPFLYMPWWRERAAHA